MGSVFGLDVSFLVKIGNLTGNAHLQVVGVKRLNRANAAYTLFRGFPESLSTDAVRAHYSHAGDDYSIRHERV